MTTDLVGESGHLLGAVRAGKILRVVSDRVGPEGRWADVEIGTPVTLRARVVREALSVFLAEDLPVGPPRTWWTAGAQARIDAGDNRRASVAIETAGRPTVSVSCDALTPTIAPERFSSESCCTVLPAARPQVGHYVWWNESQRLDIDLGPGRKRIELEYHSGRLLDRRAGEVLLEVLDTFHDLRVQR